MTLSSFLPLLGLLLAPQPASDTSEGATIVVRVANFENDDGKLGCRLFSRASAFPDGSGRSKTASINGSSGTCTFRDVAPGTYAIAAIHDENGNGVLDKNMFGVPKEGYGVSFNNTYALSAPEWDESSFSVDEGERRSFNIRLRY